MKQDWNLTQWLFKFIKNKKWMPVVYLAMFFKVAYWHLGHYIDGLVQEGRNSSALAMELRLSCTKPSICSESQWSDPEGHG